MVGREDLGPFLTMTIYCNFFFAACCINKTIKHPLSDCSVVQMNVFASCFQNVRHPEICSLKTGWLCMMLCRVSVPTRDKVITIFKHMSRHLTYIAYTLGGIKHDNYMI